MAKGTNCHYRISRQAISESRINAGRQMARQLARRSIQVNFFAFFTGAVIMAVQPASAQVPVCQALTLYGNAVNEGLCKSLSPGTQNL